MGKGEQSDVGERVLLGLSAPRNEEGSPSKGSTSFLERTYCKYGRLWDPITLGHMSFQRGAFTTQ